MNAIQRYIPGCVKTVCTMSLMYFYLQMHVLNIMSLIIERVGLEIRPHSESLIQYLPLLWQDSEEHNMLRCAIVSTLVQLVKALTSVSASMYPFLLPVIQLGTDVHQEAIVYLLEDSLELWLAVLENSTAMTHELMQLFNNMPALLGMYILWPMICDI